MRREYESGEELYAAGESVPSGIYKHLDSPYILDLAGEDTLPGRLDGRATYYVRLRHTWGAHRTSVESTSLPLTEGNETPCTCALAACTCRSVASAQNTIQHTKG